MAQYSIRFLIGLMVVAAISASQLRPGKVRASMEPVSIDPAKQVAVLRLTNDGYDPIWFYGHGAPFFSLESRTGDDGDWTADGLVGWCGTGATSHRLCRGESVEFSVFWTRGSSDRIRVRVECSPRSDMGAAGAKSISSDTIRFQRPLPRIPTRIRIQPQPEPTQSPNSSNA